MFNQESIDRQLQDWNEINYRDRPRHLDLVDERLKNCKHPNVQVRIRDQTFDCHLLMLQSYSELFDEMGNLPEVKLPEEKVTPKAFELIYQWLLSDSPRLQREHFVEVLIAAEFLRIPALINQCWTCVDNPTALIEDRAFRMYTEARHFGHTIMQNMMLKRICLYFLPLVASKEFQKLPFEDVEKLLKSNHIGVFSEVDALYAACLWLLEDWDTRSEHVGDVMKLIRFPLMSARMLSLLINCNEDERIHRILQHCITQKLAIQALTDLCTTPSELRPTSSCRSVPKVCVVTSRRSWLMWPGSPKQEDEISGCFPHQPQERSFVEFLELLQRLVENPESWLDWQRA